jgi:phosphatidylglycerol lysyltransferase
VFFGGVFLLFAGALPMKLHRLTPHGPLLPRALMESAHFLAALAGVMLLFFAYGLQRRLRRAYVLSMVVLGLGAILALLKGFDYASALVLAGLLVVLLPTWRQFYRKGSTFQLPLTTGWVTAVVLVLLCSIGLGLFAQKQAFEKLRYPGSLLWRTPTGATEGYADALLTAKEQEKEQAREARADVARFLRATVGEIGLLFVLGMATVLRPVAPRPTLPTPTQLALAKMIVARSPEASSNLALVGDKMLLMNDQQTAMIMYGIQGRSWVAMGDPQGPESERAELIWRFRELAESYYGWPVFYAVGQENVPLYLDLGLTLLKLGEEARVRLSEFSLDGEKNKALRRIQHHFERAGCTFEVVPPTGVVALMPQLHAISDGWLAGKEAREKRFSVGYFQEDYLANGPLAVVHHQGRVVAFANIWATDLKTELAMDVMRHLPQAPQHIMEFLSLELMLWGRVQGYEWFNLGMAPVSGAGDPRLQPIWNRLGALVFRQGEHFFSFESLRQYKEGFHPIWRPLYLALPSGFGVPRILADITYLVSRDANGANGLKQQAPALWQSSKG